MRRVGVEQGRVGPVRACDDEIIPMTMSKRCNRRALHGDRSDPMEFSSAMR